MATQRICSIPSCDKPLKARGWCGGHWQRWSKYGDPLGGSTSPGEPARYFSDVVMAYEGDECTRWPFALTRGYGYMWHEGRNEYVHHRVCELVNGPAPSPIHEAAHSCGEGRRGCVTKKHLSWKTRVENQADRVLHGTTNRGERMARGKLTEAKVHEIRALRGRLSQSKIAAQFGVSRENVRNIHLRRIWGWME